MILSASICVTTVIQSHRRTNLVQVSAIVAVHGGVQHCVRLVADVLERVLARKSWWKSSAVDILAVGRT